MKRFVIANVFAWILMAAVLPVHAVGRLSVELREASPSIQAQEGVHSGVVEMVLTNTGNQALEIDNETIPFAFKDGKLTYAVFKVQGPDGNEPQYLGAMVETEGEALWLQTLRPGQILVKRVNLLRNYKIDPGKPYSVSIRLPIRYLDRPKAEYGQASAREVHGLMKVVRVSPIRVIVDRASVESMARLSSKLSETDNSAACTSTQNSQFEAARQIATQKAVEASGFLTGQFSWTVEGEDNEVIEHFANPPRYVRWFGHHPDPYPAMQGPGVVDSGIRTAVDVNPGRIGGMTLSCVCDSTKVNPATTAAYVIPTETYVVHACPNFWIAPDLPTVADETSKAGTIIHEAIHFSDQYWGGAGSGTDGKGHYSGPSYQDALNLAASDRASAAKNPNNYKFYSLDPILNP